MLDENVRSQLESALTGMRQNLDAEVAVFKNDPKMAEIIASHKQLNDLEGMLERRKTPLAELFGLEAEQEKEAPSTIKIDEFYGLLPLEAAKRYLRRKGSAASLDEIVAAIKAGGCKVNSASNLRKTLTRSTWQVAKVGKDAFGLTEFYGGRKRNAKKEKAAGAIDAAEEEEEEVDEEEESEAVSA